MAKAHISGVVDITHVGGEPPVPGKPEHPIVLPPSPPLVIWGGGNETFPTPPIWIPPQTPGEPGKPPLVLWGGANEPLPTPPIVIFPQPIPPAYISGPGGPWITPPIFLPVQKPDEPKPPLVLWGGCNENFVTPPIYLPPQLPAGPGKPPVIWGGGNAEFPTNPIVIPIPPMEEGAPGVVIPEDFFAPGVPPVDMLIQPADEAEPK